MRVLFSFFFMFIYLSFVGCSGHEAKGDRIKNADRVDVLYNTGNEVLKYTDTSRKVVHTFKEVLNGKVEKRKCSTMGEIRFFSKDSLLFEAGFSISASKERCRFLMVGEDAWPLTDAAGMFLIETLNDLKKQ